MKRDTGIYSKKQVDSAMLCITKITLRFPLNPDLLQQNKRIVEGSVPGRLIPFQMAEEPRVRDFVLSA